MKKINYPEEVRSCIHCSKKFRFKPFPSRKNSGKFCSIKCRHNSDITQIQCSCIKCNKKFMVNKFREDKAKFCSNSCRAKYRTGILAPNFGINHSEESKEKMRIASWRGGKIKRYGYVFIYFLNHPFRRKNGYMPEHRLVIEQYVGRYLKTSEHVHHINHIRDDNRISNLMCFSSVSAHMRFHKNPENVKPEEIIFDGRNH